MTAILTRNKSTASFNKTIINYIKRNQGSDCDLFIWFSLFLLPSFIRRLLPYICSRRVKLQIIFVLRSNGRCTHLEWLGFFYSIQYIWCFQHKVWGLELIKRRHWCLTISLSIVSILQWRERERRKRETKYFLLSCNY